jgi:hypothetical protein
LFDRSNAHSSDHYLTIRRVDIGKSIFFHPQ